MFSILALTLWCLSIPFLVRGQAITCYDFDGSKFLNNTLCGKPDGSQTCCATASDCLQNKMCVGNGELVRPTCAIYPWNNGTCAQLCSYVTGTGVLPRIQLCPDGSYCCNNDAYCCDKGKGHFLDPSGKIISNPYITKTTASETSPAAQATTVAATTVHATPTGSASSSRGLSAAAEGVIGALAGVLFLTFVAAGLFTCKKRRQVHSLKSEPPMPPPQMESYDLYQQDHTASKGYAPAELRAFDGPASPVRRELASELAPSRMSA